MRRRASGASLAALLLALGVGPLTTPAWGFVRAKTDGGIPIYWTSSCVPVTIYASGFADMSQDDVAKSLAAAAHAWSPDAVSCVATDGSVSHPYLEIVPGLAAAGADAPHAANDGRNEVIFIIAGWQDEGHPVEAVAVTTLTKKRDGRILDADVEINAEWDSWTNFDPGATVTTGNGQPDPFDLQNAITHEFGHFIGLDHTCYGPADRDRQIDNNGDPVFDCDFAPASVKATVMYAAIDSAGIETSKRYLTSDDVAGVCAIYPAEQDPRVCSLDLPDDGCGCATGAARGGRRGSATAILLSLVALFTMGRARPGRRGQTARRG